MTGRPTLPDIRAAGVAVFEARAYEAEQLGLTSRSWPPNVIGHRHWANDFVRAANSAELELSIDDATAAVNAWIAEIATC